MVSEALVGNSIVEHTSGPSPSFRCELSRLRCHGHSLLLPSYLCRIKRKENSSCSACGHPLQDLIHLLLDCPASEPLRRAIFGTTSPFLTSGPDLGVWPDCWVSVEFLHVPIPQKGSGSTITTNTPQNLDQRSNTEKEAKDNVAIQSDQGRDE